MVGQSVRRSEGEPRKAATLLRSVLTSPPFRRELREVSGYAAHVKQERQIVDLLAKKLYRDHEVVLECQYPEASARTKCDLRLDEVYIEFKCHYNTDVWRATEELKKRPGRHPCPRDPRGNQTWKVLPGLCRDIVTKRPDIFVWIICQRDLGSCTDSDIRRVAWGEEQRRDERQRGDVYLSEDLLGLAKRLLKAFKTSRAFSVENVTVCVSSRQFPSRYHFVICTFRT